MKNLLPKTKTYKAFRHALCEWRNTPRYDGLSPSQWLTSHHQRNGVIAAPEAYKRISDTELKEHEHRRGHRLEKEKARVDQSLRILEPKKPGDSVLVQDPKTSRWSIEATVVLRRNKRSYNIEIDSRRHIRNQQFLKPVIVTKRLLLKRLLPKRSVPKRMFPKRPLPKRRILKRLLLKRLIPKRLLPKRPAVRRKTTSYTFRSITYALATMDTESRSVIEIQVCKAYPNLGEVM